MSTPIENRIKVGFRTSIIALFIGIVLFVGLTLVYLSFSRIAAITQSAASTFIDKVAQLGADRIDSQFKNVRDCLDILSGIPSIQSAEIEDNPRLIAVMGSMLRNNRQLFNLYVGYQDGSFLEIDAIDRAGAAFRQNLKAPEDAVYRLVVIASVDLPAEGRARHGTGIGRSGTCDGPVGASPNVDPLILATVLARGTAAPLRVSPRRLGPAMMIGPPQGPTIILSGIRMLNCSK